MEIPVLRKPEGSKRYSLWTYLILAICFGAAAAWLLSRPGEQETIQMAAGGSSQPAAGPGSGQMKAPSAGTSAGVSDPAAPAEQETAAQIPAGDGAPQAEAVLPKPGVSAITASARAGAEGAAGSDPGASLAAPASGKALAGGAAGAGPARAGAADGAAPKVPLKWDPAGSVDPKLALSGHSSGASGQSAQGQKVRSSGTVTRSKKNAGYDYDSLIKSVAALETQAAKLTQAQIRQIQQAIAAEEGRYEKAASNAPPYQPPPPQAPPLKRGKVWPVGGKSRVSQEFGPTNWEVYGGRTYNGRYYPHFHSGIDIAAPKGTPILANDAGKVIYAGGNQRSGVGVIVQHPDGTSTTYHHMGLGAAGPTVRPGQYVGSGQVLGYIGMTGMTTGPHLHFVLQSGGNVRNPREVLPKK
ncbi:MAG: M23 family metallopeptidase [Elusimicrobia bacterium]|nr:M23 family metallopeptidase [Elusimicrobiota bacterium]